MSSPSGLKRVVKPHGPLRAWFASAVRRRRRSGDPVLAVAASVLGLIVLVGLVGPLLWHHSESATSLLEALEAPSLRHPMGTDDTGRDILIRFMIGARISLAIGALVVVIGALVGALIGTVSGMVGGFIDTILMRFMDAVLAFPALILAMAITIALGAGLWTAATGVIVSSVPWYARVVRSEVLRLKGQPLVEAARAIGSTRTRVVMRHIIPHLAPTLIVQASSAFGSAILSLAALGFIGLGAQIPTPEWGAMITNGLQYTLTGQWWVGVFPGLGLLICVTAAGIIADRVGDRLDPRSTLVRG